MQKVQSFDSLVRYVVLILLVLFFLSIQINSKQLFFQIGGLSLRYFIIPLIVLFILTILKSNRNYKVYLGVPWSILFFLALLPIIFRIDQIDVVLYSKNIFFYLFQILTYFTLLNILLKYVTLKQFVVILKIALIFHTIFPIILYFIQFKKAFIIGSTLGIFYGMDGLPRLTGFFSDPNYFGLNLSVIFYVYFYLGIIRKMEQKKSLFIISSLFLFTILLTFSRAAIGTTVLFFALFFLIFSPSFKKYFLFLLITVSILIIILILNSEFLSIFWLKLTTPGADKGSFDQRSELLRSGIQSFTLYPFGVGIGNMINYYKEVLGIAKLAHNDFISVLIEAGIIGFISYLWLYIYIFIKSDLLGRIIIFVIVLYLCTLTCYSYEPLVPIFLASFIVIKNNLFKKPDIEKESFIS